MTILVSSHILSELDEYCSHMLVIKQGRIQAFQALQDENTDRQTVRLCFATEESVLRQVYCKDWITFMM